MWIEIEPGEMLMLRIGLFFAKDHPDPEDKWIRDYLEANQLEPRRRIELERDGEPIEVLQFGQCYIDPHAQRIREIRIRGYERAALLHVVPQFLAEGGIELPAGSDDLIAEIAERVHPEAGFAGAGDDRLEVYLDPATVVTAYHAVAKQPSQEKE